MSNSKRNIKIVGLEDFELKIDQIAANENGLSNNLKDSINDEDNASNWITQLYRRYNDDPISTDEIENNTSSILGYA